MFSPLLSIRMAFSSGFDVLVVSGVESELVIVSLDLAAIVVVVVGDGVSLVLVVVAVE